MKHQVSIGIAFLCFALFCISGLTVLRRVQAQSTQAPGFAGRNSANSQKSEGRPASTERTIAKPTLQCQGCHGPGKTLPYLAERFSTHSSMLPTIKVSTRKLLGRVAERLLVLLATR